MASNSVRRGDDCDHSRRATDSNSAYAQAESVDEYMATDSNSLAAQIKAGDRRVTGQRRLRLVESTRSDHRQSATLSSSKSLMPATGNSIRLGISGVPWRR